MRPRLAWPSFLLGVVFDDLLKGRQRLVPEPLKLLTQRRQAGWVGLIDAPVPQRPVDHQARVLEHPQVLRDCGAADGQLAGQFADGPGTLSDAGEDLASRRVA